MTKKKNTSSRHDSDIINIVGSYGSHGANFARIKTMLYVKNGQYVSCLEGILKRMVIDGILKENKYGVYRRDFLSMKQRKCLRCGEYFRSEGIHNRMCPQCKKWAAAQC